MSLLKYSAKLKVPLTQTDVSNSAKQFTDINVNDLISFENSGKLIHNMQENNNSQDDDQEVVIRTIDYNNYIDNQSTTNSRNCSNQKYVSATSNALKTDKNKSDKSTKKVTITNKSDSKGTLCGNASKGITKNNTKNTEKILSNKKINKENVNCHLDPKSKPKSTIINRNRVTNSRILSENPSISERIALKSSLKNPEQRKVTQINKKSSQTCEKLLSNEKSVKINEKRTISKNIPEKTKQELSKHSYIQSNISSVSKTIPRLQSTTQEKKNSKRVINPKLTRSRTQVKIVTSRNTAKSKLNVYVGPGIVGNRARSLPSVSEIKKTSVENNQNDDLSMPVYNSITGTIHKLRDMKEKKIVTDIDNLPTKFRSRVFKKALSTLDFPPDKSIFHDLIDLSVNESLLPKRIMRTKDPPPRPKDLQPKLSDFFTPQYGKEFLEIVETKPQTQKISNNCNAFHISDLIFKWKTKLDDNNF